MEVVMAMTGWQVAAMVLVLLIGFALGLTLLRTKSRWCAACGNTLTCPSCAARRRATGNPYI
jgi:hypothetical protein